MIRDHITTLIREPYNAGRFYPSDPVELRRIVTGYIDAAPVVKENRPDGIISPHAGYVYSGHVAGHAYRQLVGHSYDSVVVLAPSHFEPLNYMSIMPEGFYQTLLGDVAINSELAEEITQKHDRFRLSYDGHLVGKGGYSEHSLEVQIPFLQVALNEFKLVPIIIGNGCLDPIEELGQVLAEIMTDRNVLLVASTDLSHFHGYNDANRIDGRIIELIKARDVSAIVRGCRNRDVEACGYLPVAVLLSALESERTHVEILKYANSGDVVDGSHDRVVGYLAASVYKNKSGDKDAFRLTDEEKRALLAAARESVRQRDEVSVGTESVTDSLRAERGLFVTLTKQGELRGCIGTMTPQQPLYELIGHIAYQAAFHDPRFAPVEADELDDIEYEITVLEPFTRVNDVNKIIIGRDGLMIRKDGRQGVLLPQVASDRGWSREQFLEAICQKANLPRDAWKGGAKLWKFSAFVFSEE